MNESITEMQKLLREVAAHLNAGSKMAARNAVAKRQRIAALASTSVFTTQCR